MQELKIIIADDHPVVRDSLKLFFQIQMNSTFVEEAIDGMDFIKKVSESHFDLAMIDIEMPLKNGIESTREALLIKPDLKILAFSSYEDINLIKGVLDAGAGGYVLKNADFDELKLAISWIMENKRYCSAKVFDILTKQLNNKNTTITTILTYREIEILKLIANGLSREEISEKLFISKRTFDKHRDNMLQKSSAKNIAGLIKYAIKNNIIL